MKPSKKAIKAREFDKNFDEGKDITPHLDIRTAKIQHPTQRINVDIPKGLLERVDQEAARVGIPRTSLIKVWIAERLERTG